MKNKKALLTVAVGFITAFVSTLILTVVVALVLTMYLSTQSIGYFSLGPKGIFNIFTYTNVNGSTDTSFRAGGLFLSLLMGILNGFLSFLVYNKYSKRSSKLAS